MYATLLWKACALLRGLGVTDWTEIWDSGGPKHSVADDGYNHWEEFVMDVSGPAPVVVIHSFGVQCPLVGLCAVYRVSEKVDCRPPPCLSLPSKGPP